MGRPERFQWLHVLLALSFLILSLKYESILTSEMTVPPPALVFADLHELVMEKGFKLHYPVWNMSQLAGYDLYEFKQGFAQYGVEPFYANIQVRTIKISVTK